MTFTINVSYDASVTALDTPGNSAYNPTLYIDYTSAVQTAVQFYEGEFTNPVMVSISFGWGEVAGSPLEPGALGESNTYTDDFTYRQLLAAVQNSDTTSLVQQAAVLTLPAKDPTGGATFSVATVEARALGLDASYTGPDGSVGLNSNATYSWNQTSIAGGTYDAVGTLEHEISEVLGREDDAGVNNSYTLLDMFRYTAANGLAGDALGSAAGQRDEPFAPGYSTTAPASATAGLNSYSYFSYNGSTVTLPYDSPSAVASGADVADWAATTVADAYGYADAGQADRVSTTDLQEMNVLGYDLVACFLLGTGIATPSGEVPVQHLAVGDSILTHRGDVRPVVWIGRGRARPTRGRRSAVTPVIVRKGAIGDNVPSCDLHVTKGHALYIDNVLIPVEFLINHRTILWDDDTDQVTVYHIELPVHDVILANRTPTESYRDDGNRQLFLNDSTVGPQPAKPPCAPVLTGGAVVDAIWKRLLDRAGPKRGMPLTDEPDLHLLVGGRRVEAVRRPRGCYAFRLSPGSGAIRIVSRAAAPDVIGLARDPRLLGVALRRIILWRGRRPTVIDSVDQRLSHGFYAHEGDNDFRWTNGDAVLPASLLDDGKRVTSIDLHVAATMRYPLLEYPVSEAAA